MSKYNLHPTLTGKKRLKPSDRQKYCDKIIGVVRSIFADSELPICEIECNTKQGVTESPKLLQAYPEHSLNGTFTITININGGAMNVEELEELLFLEPKGGILRGIRRKS